MPGANLPASRIKPGHLYLGVLAWLFSMAGSGLAETVPVPGGPEGVAMLFGTVDPDQNRFVESLNRALLESTPVDHDWKKAPERVQLVDYLQNVQRLEREVGNGLEVGSGTDSGRKQLRKLGSLLGYRVAFNRKGPVIQPEEGDGAAGRRRLAAALGVDLEQLLAERSAVFHLPAGEAALPLPLTELSSWIGQSIDRSRFFETLAQDQRWGLLLEGRRRITLQGQRWIGRRGMRWSYENAPSSLFRYGGALDWRDGMPVLPGGPATGGVWEDIVGTSPSGDGFFEALLSRRGGRIGYLWHALAFATPDTARFYLGIDSPPTTDDRNYVRRLLRRLDEAAGRGFDFPRGGDLGFPVFVRSVPLTAHGAELDLPGGPGLWYEAIKGDRVPRDPEELSAAVRKAGGRGLDQGDLVLRSLTETVDRGSLEVPTLPRLIRAANFFRGRAHLATPENVILVARSADWYEPALETLDGIDPHRPEVVQEYLLAVGHLDDLATAPESELLITNFQSGVEWIRALALQGEADREVLEEQLLQWSRLHRRHHDPWSAAREQIAVLEALLDALPEPPPDQPGRAPAEQRLFAAWTGISRQTFELNGLSYEGNRGHDLAQAITERLAAQGIPPVDRLLDLRTALDQVVAAGRAADLEAVRESAERVAGELRDFPILEPGPPLDGHRHAILTGTWRSEIGAAVQAIAAESRPKKLVRLADRLAQEAGRLAGALRVVLLGPVYAAAMGESRAPLFDEPELVLAHELYRGGGGAVLENKAWIHARSVRGEGSQLGSLLRGHVNGVPAALAEEAVAAVPGAGMGVPAAFWYQALIARPWSRLTPPICSLVAELEAAGAVLARNALAEIRADQDGPYGRFVSARVPRARLERTAAGAGPGVSPAEHVVLGLSAFAGDELGPAAPELLQPALADRLRLSRETLGDGWRSLLDAAGVPTPHLSGRTRPWIGAWPSYESVEREYLASAIEERMLVDLRVALVAYLGRTGLPSTAGPDLAWQLVSEGLVGLRLESNRDWEGFVRWLGDLEDDAWDALLREALKDGLYRLQASS